MTAPSHGVQTQGWIVDARFDLTWLFGGALLSLAAMLLTLGLHLPIVLVFWIWLLAFDGPHMAAAYTRTYLDRSERRERAALFSYSLACFLVGPACLVFDVLLQSPWPFSIFLGVAATYGYYHVVRQHYGFLALYKARRREQSRIDLYVDKWCLYIGCWAPYIYFLITHPRARALIGAVPEVPAVVTFALIAASVLAPLVLLANGMRAPAAKSRQKLAYVLLVILLHELIYFSVSRFEPVYGASTGPDTDFLLLSVMITVFHNVQYVALVWNHNRNRYAGGDTERFGAAAWTARTPARYLAACAAFAPLYLALAAATGVYPALRVFEQRMLGTVSWNQIGLAVWWGLALHHYVLDQRIWRLRSDPRLRAHLMPSATS